MTEIFSFVLIVGAVLVDTLEAWVLALMGVVIAADLLAGIRYKILIFFGVFQVAGLVGGYFWALEQAQQLDVSGPYAWAIVVGFWCVLTCLGNAAVFLFGLITSRHEA